MRIFILCVEILFTIVKNKKSFKSLKVLVKTAYTAYANDTTLFLKNLG